MADLISRCSDQKQNGSVFNCLPCCFESSDKPVSCITVSVQHTMDASLQTVTQLIYSYSEVWIFCRLSFLAHCERHSILNECCEFSKMLEKCTDSRCRLS